MGLQDMGEGDAPQPRTGMMARKAADVRDRPIVGDPAIG
jgi:hypothetical protein